MTFSYWKTMSSSAQDWLKKGFCLMKILVQGKSLCLDIGMVQIRYD
jgi:hypothetical protein